MLPLVKHLGLERSLTLNISTKGVAICNYLSKNNFVSTCSFFNIYFVMSCVISMFKISIFFFVGCVYSLMAFAMDGGPPNRHFISFVAFLFGVPLIWGKLEAFVLGDNTSYAYFEVWSNVICSFIHVIKN
jgi:hypothetical protein